VTDLILHHYALSPFSEKVRAMLGYADLPWCSAITREMPPRPILKTLAGGYRRVPIAQCGADIFCDSAMITSEIALRTGKPELARQNCSAEVNRFITQVESQIFFACVMASTSWALNRKMMQTLPLLDVFRLFSDRLRMSRKASVPMVKAGQVKGIVRQHLQDMEAHLQQDFLFGDVPNVADFAAYHSLWMIRDAGEKRTVSHYPKVNAWMDRIKAFGEGQRREIDPATTLEIARAAQPRALTAAETADELVGTQVSITPNDYAQDETRGELVGSTADRWIIARETAEVGRLHVHFPKLGFNIVGA